MMTTERYQGWKNYETWAIALHIDNHQGDYSYWHERADELFGQPHLPDDETKGGERATLDLAEELKQQFEENKDGLLEDAKQQNGLWADLLNSALSEVDWYELAGHYVEGARERAAK